MDLGLNGRTALITGADSGIGWHTAKLLLAEGAKVAITDLDSDELTQACLLNTYQSPRDTER